LSDILKQFRKIVVFVCSWLYTDLHCHQSSAYDFQGRFSIENFISLSWSMIKLFNYSIICFHLEERCPVACKATEPGFFLKFILSCGCGWQHISFDAHVGIAVHSLHAHKQLGSWPTVSSNSTCYIQKWLGQMDWVLSRSHFVTRDLVKFHQIGMSALCQLTSAFIPITPIACRPSSLHHLHPCHHPAHLYQQILYLQVRFNSETYLKIP